ncbi:ISL3 family transposase [Lactobacillus xujianguonis]|uniref:ISL3 family transposase n=1 Tax=Lactobacillus xujianguonis TaxID=2495899 RepID=A0A437STL6_9LACO|nr:ISL3 family transposase [Lactobacillus xujianguonis]RVU70235.1 ISL3 family transposase [Lactobacillus xujianguonis]
MNYNESNLSTQALVDQTKDESGVLFYNSGLKDFLQAGFPLQTTRAINYGTKAQPRVRDVNIQIFQGSIAEKKQFCPHCRQSLVKSGSSFITLSHLPMGSGYTKLQIARSRLRCLNSSCTFSTYTAEVPFKDKRHRITKQLKDYTKDLLLWGLTLKSAAFITGLDKMTVKSIHKEILKKKYTRNGKLIKPEHFARHLAIDKFKLHDGYKYATAIIDWDTGHILYLAHGKKKQVVYDFIDHVGQDWMAHVEAVACDMNSDFEEAFKEKCPKIDIVYDHFHIIKNFNDKVVAAIRKDEQKRLIQEGRDEEAASLKHTKYILTSKLEILIQKDQDAHDGKLVAKAGEIFNRPEIKAHGGNQDKYEDLLAENKLFLTAELVKEQLDKAYCATKQVEMCVLIQDIIDICRGTENKRFIWFARMLERHLTGIYTFAQHHISTGRLEGLNNKIKTERRKGYGYPDDEYFFLRLMEASRRKTVY